MKDWRKSGHRSRGSFAYRISRHETFPRSLSASFSGKRMGVPPSLGSVFQSYPVLVKPFTLFLAHITQIVRKVVQVVVQVMHFCAHITTRILKVCKQVYSLTIDSSQLCRPPKSFYQPKRTNSRHWNRVHSWSWQNWSHFSWAVVSEDHQKCQVSVSRRWVQKFYTLCIENRIHLV